MSQKPRLVGKNMPAKQGVNAFVQRERAAWMKLLLTSICTVGSSITKLNDFFLSGGTFHGPTDNRGKGTNEVSSATVSWSWAVLSDHACIDSQTYQCTSQCTRYTELPNVSRQGYWQDYFRMRFLIHSHLRLHGKASCLPWGLETKREKRKKKRQQNMHSLLKMTLPSYRTEGANILSILPALVTKSTQRLLSQK